MASAHAAVDAGNLEAAAYLYVEACRADANLCDVAAITLDELGMSDGLSELFRIGCEGGVADACEQAYATALADGDDMGAEWAHDRLCAIEPLVCGELAGASASATSAGDHAPAGHYGEAPRADDPAQRAIAGNAPPCSSGETCAQVAADVIVATGEVLSAVPVLDYACDTLGDATSCEHVGLILVSMGVGDDLDRGARRLREGCALGSSSACQRADTVDRSLREFGHEVPEWMFSDAGLRFVAAHGWVFDAVTSHPAAPSADRVVLSETSTGLAAVFLIETTMSELDAMDELGAFVTMALGPTTTVDATEAIPITWSENPAMRTRGRGLLDGQADARFELVAVPGTNPNTLVLGLSIWSPGMGMPPDEGVLGDLISALRPVSR